MTPMLRHPYGIALLAWFAGISTGFAQTPFEPLPAVGETLIHDPSTIQQEGGRYYVFGTGVGLRVRTSTNLVDWTEAPPVFPKTPGWTTNAVPGFRGHMWAPEVVRVNGQWHLYYSVSTFGKQVSAIGLATSPTLDAAATNYVWIDRGPVLQSKAGDDFNAIDPSVLLDADGKLWMAYGSFWKGLYLVELDARTGLRPEPAGAPQRLAWSQAIEAACLTRHAGKYYLFINWGQCCRGTNSTYEVRVGRSTKITGPYLDHAGVDLVNGGGRPFLATSGRYIGPGHIGILTGRGTNWFSYHYYDGESRGRSRLAVGQLEWTDEGWPVAKAVR